MKKEVWHLPIEKPSVVGWKPPDTITGNAGRLEAWTVEVLGPPVPAIPDALSPEARAVLEAAVAWDRAVFTPYNKSAYLRLVEARKAYAATLAPPDPLREARGHLDALKEHVMLNADALSHVLHATAALDRLAEQGGAA